MSNVQVTSNYQSALTKALTSRLQSDLSYGLSEQMPPLATTTYSISPDNAPVGTLEGKSMSFKVLRNGLVRSMAIKSTVTNSANNNSAADNTSFGERIFKSIALKAGGRQVAQNSDGYSTCRRYDTDIGTSKALSSFTNGATTLTTGAVVTYYTPFFCSFFDRLENNMDLSFIEQLTLTADFADQFGLSTGTLASGVFTLEIQFVELDDKALFELRSQNFGGPGTTFEMLSYNTETAIYTADSTTSLTVDLKNSQLCSRIHFFLRRSQATGNSARVAISSYTVTASGQQIRSSVPSKLSEWYKNRDNVQDIDVGVLGTTCVNAAAKPITVNFGVSNARTWDSGAMSFQNVSSPQLTVNMASTATTDLVVVYEYWQLLQIDGGSGRIATGISG